MCTFPVPSLRSFQFLINNERVEPVTTRIHYTMHTLIISMHTLIYLLAVHSGTADTGEPELPLDHSQILRIFRQGQGTPGTTLYSMDNLNQSLGGQREATVFIDTFGSELRDLCLRYSDKTKVY